MARVPCNSFVVAAVYNVVVYELDLFHCYRLIVSSITSFADAAVADLLTLNDVWQGFLESMVVILPLMLKLHLMSLILSLDHFELNQIDLY